MSAAKGSGPIDAKREEFRKYLEKEGILESLTRALVRRERGRGGNTTNNAGGSCDTSLGLVQRL